MSAATMRRDIPATVSGPCIVDHDIRCWRCNRKQAVYSARPWRYICNKCKATTSSPDPLIEQRMTPFEGTASQPPR